MKLLPLLDMITLSYGLLRIEHGCLPECDLRFSLGCHRDSPHRLKSSSGEGRLSIKGGYPAPCLALRIILLFVFERFILYER